MSIPPRRRDSFQQPLISPSFPPAQSLDTSVDTRYHSAQGSSPAMSGPTIPVTSSRTTTRTSKRLILSYVLDWVVIALLVVVGGGLQLARPSHRAFSLLSLDNSFPLLEETVPVWLAGVLAIAMPIIVVTIVALVFVPGFAALRTMDRRKMWRIKLWELERGLAGLALSIAATFFATQCLKNLFGKPRPNMLARCQPDLDNFSQYVIGGYGQDISPRWTLVTYKICQNSDRSVLDDGFRSFPSGHSSISWAGLLYLTLFLCSKFNIAIPSLPAVSSSSTSHKHSPKSPTHSLDHEMTPLQQNGRAFTAPKESSTYDRTNNDPDASLAQAHQYPAHPFRIRHLAATPPNYLLIPAFTPIGIALWICATRYADFYHFGFDIIFGSLIGIFTAWFSFRWYHLPLSRGHGWAWGARSVDRAFGIGVGTDGYVRHEQAERKRRDDRRLDLV